MHIIFAVYPTARRIETSNSLRALAARAGRTRGPSIRFRRTRSRQEGLFREFVSFVTDDDGAPIFENTMQYAILRKESAGVKTAGKNRAV